MLRRYKIAVAVAMLLGGLSPFAIAQGRPTPGAGSTADRSKTPGAAAPRANAPGVVVGYPELPSGFDPRTASDEELRRYGLPPRPDPHKAPEAYSRWQALVSVPRKANPKLQPTTIYNGPAQSASVPVERKPQQPQPGP